MYAGGVRNLNDFFVVIFKKYSSNSFLANSLLFSSFNFLHVPPSVEFLKKFLENVLVVAWRLSERGFSCS
jgi:hypothetical protein